MPHKESVGIAGKDAGSPDQGRYAGLLHLWLPWVGPVWLDIQLHGNIIAQLKQNTISKIQASSLSIIFDCWYQEERHKKYNEEDAPKKFQYLSNFIGDNKWATGNDITYVDFLTYEILFQMTVFNPKCLDKFPNLTAYIRRFEELPAIQKYMNSDSFIKGPCFGVNSGYKF